MGKKTFNFGNGLLIGAVLGAAAVYFLNEERRNNFKKKAIDKGAKAADQLADKLEDLKNTLEEESGN
ncbi:MAG TPA: YtxH domain-containing protein [Bacteroidales bacterium]|nr:YtxH domain-containing protein [Bacteroidales bacterium]